MIKCPECNAGSDIIDSRSRGNTQYRRRECVSCGYRWTTFEVSKKRFNFLKKAQRLLRELTREQ